MYIIGITGIRSNHEVLSKQPQWSFMPFESMRNKQTQSEINKHKAGDHWPPAIVMKMRC